MALDVTLMMVPDRRFRICGIIPCVIGTTETIGVEDRADCRHGVASKALRRGVI